MKKTLIFFFLLSLSVLCFSQNDTIFIEARLLETHDISKSCFTQLDTSAVDFYNYNPVYKQSFSATYLGNIGQAAVANIYFNRADFNEFIFAQPYSAYLFNRGNIRFYNTNKPYTRLQYSATLSNDKEQVLKVIHTQNISRHWNVGTELNLISSEGQYLGQKTKDIAFNFQTSYRRLHYQIHAGIILNKIKVSESGGIVDSFDVDANFIPVNLRKKTSSLSDNSNAESILASKVFFVNQSYSIGRVENFIVKDTLKARKIEPMITFSHEVDYSINHKIYKDDFTTAYKPDYYNYTAYVDSLQSLDSTICHRLENTVQVKFNDGVIPNFRLGSRVFFKNEHNKIYNFRDYLVSKMEETNSSTSIGAAIFNENGQWFRWSVTGEYFFDGYKNKNKNIEANIMKVLQFTTDSMRICAQFWLQNRSATVYEQRYFANRIKWDTSFVNQDRRKIAVQIIKPAWNFEIGFNYEVIENYIFFDTLALPAQANGSLSITSAYIKKQFHWKHFHSTNYIIYQKSSDSLYLEIPEFLAHTSNYLEYGFFKRALVAQFGFEVIYYSKFSPAAYMPASGQLYMQNKTSTGNYPILNIFINMRIRRANLFFNMQHLNSLLTKDKFYLAKNYPIDDFAVKFGVSWRFHD